MSILKVVHNTTFTYAKPISSSYNEARLTPAWLPRQRVLESKLEIHPLSWKSTYRDYWETEVVVFEVTEPHTSLSVTATSQVEVLPVTHKADRAGWDALEGPMFQDLLSEYLAASNTTEPSEDLMEFAREQKAKGGPDAAARAICDYLNSEMRYVPGSTHVHSLASDAWSEKSGVCQDFAHLAIGALRSIGIPARYVSGYLHPKPDAEIGETVRGESHAWVEWWTGDWFGFDPTNDKEAGDHHVIVARAREYRDVAPLTGVFGGSTSNLEVSVKVTLLG
ncbi:transglutaminase family protein [Demequina sp.]|uniref:transglutaminase family protein n=1 Tax=Demequina sp. TaxID=2050685 RepID=UPI0025C4A6CC|nr:transglutaminase family protein [Demequina sp.]